MQIEKLLEENKEKDVAEILKILAWQQVITSQGATYTGEKDWALNKILDWQKQSLKQFIDWLVEREEKNIVHLRVDRDFLTEWNDAKQDTVDYLKKIRKQVK